MRTIIAVAAATLVLAFTAHADEVAATPAPNTRLANTCALNHAMVSRAAYTPGRPAKCAQFLATGNVLHTHHWSRT
jgi:hypothetical protein